MTGSSMKKITLNLARTKEFPEGSIRHGYEFIAPLDAGGYIDAAVWKERRNLCSVHRFWADEPVLRGHLVHRPGGGKGATWGFDYDAMTHDDDEAGFRFGEHAFKIGEYVSVRGADGRMETFKVAAVSSV